MSAAGQKSQGKKYKIAWLPGDGIGIEVLEAAKIVLDKLHLNAEYIHGADYSRRLASC